MARKLKFDLHDYATGKHDGTVLSEAKVTEIADAERDG